MTTAAASYTFCSGGCEAHYSVACASVSRASTHILTSTPPYQPPILSYTTAIIQRVAQVAFFAANAVNVYEKSHGKVDLELLRNAYTVVNGGQCERKYWKLLWGRGEGGMQWGGPAVVLGMWVSCALGVCRNDDRVVTTMFIHAMPFCCVHMCPCVLHAANINHHTFHPYIPNSRRCASCSSSAPTTKPVPG